MPNEISKFKYNGTVWNMKDAESRQQLASCVNNGDYDSNTKKIVLRHDNNVIIQIDATEFIKDGMVSNVQVVNGYLVITFNTDAGQEPIRIPITDIFNPNNYYTKSQVDDVVPADVTRTQSDATFVNSSNQPVFYLRQASSTLAGIMTSAEHNKLSDLPSNSELTQTLNGKVGIVDNGAYDVTVHNSNATFASLQALLNSENLSTLIPTDVRKGGMSIKFVQSSDNNYVQYLYRGTSTAVAVFTNTANWEKTNIVKELDSLCFENVSEKVSASVSVSGKYVSTNGYIGIYAPYAISENITLKKGDIITAVLKANDVVSAISKVRPVQNMRPYISEVIGAGDNMYRTYIWKADEDCDVVLSFVIYEGAGATYYITSYQIERLIYRNDKTIQGITLKGWTDNFAHIVDTLNEGDWAYNYNAKVFGVRQNSTIVPVDDRAAENVLYVYQNQLYFWNGESLEKYNTASQNGNFLQGLVIKVANNNLYSDTDYTKINIGDYGYNMYGKYIAKYNGYDASPRWTTISVDKGTLIEYENVLYTWTEDGTLKLFLDYDAIADQADILAAADTNFLNLSDGISQTDINNGTSKYDVMKENMSDNQLINSAVGVYYNLKKISHEGKSIYTFGSEWANICVPDATPELSTYYNYNNGLYSPKPLEDTVIQAQQIDVLHPKLITFEMMLALDEWWDNYANNGQYDPNNIHRCAKYYNSYIAIIRKAYKEWGAIPILTYHMGNPYMVTSNLGPAVIIPEHPNVVSEILNNTGTVCGRDLEYANPKAYFESRITKLANFVKELKDENNNPIPVIIRLFQEMDALHDWWGATRCSDSEYITFARSFKDGVNTAAGTHNIMWTYSTTYKYKTVDEMYNRYPGNDYIDIVGFDMYNAAAKAYDSSLNGWETFDSFCKLGRVYTTFAKLNGKVFGLDEWGDATTGRILINSGTYFNNVLFKFLKSIGNECAYVCGYSVYCNPTEQVGINDRNKFLTRSSIVKHDAVIGGSEYSTNINLTVISEN